MSSGIETGSAVAWATRSLIEAWVDRDWTKLDDVLDENAPRLGELIYYLTVVVGGTVNAVAIAAGKPYAAVVADLWAQLAQREDDSDEARLMRATVTAWGDGNETAQALNDSGAFSEVDLETLIGHFLGVTRLVAQLLAEALGKPLDDALGGIWTWLGTTDA